MDFRLTDEQVMLRDSAARYLNENYDFEAYRKIRAMDNGFDKSRWQQYAEMGWLLIELPEEQGGLGCGFLETLLVAEELGRAMALEPFISSAVIGSYLLSKCKDNDFAASVLAETVEGSSILALAYLDRNNGEGSAAGVSAKRMEDGFCLTGFKSLALDAPAADWLVVPADIDGQVGLFLVDKNDTSLRIESYPTLHGGSAADVGFNSVRVENQALLLSGNEASDYMAMALDRASIATMAMALGAMEKVVDISAEYLKTRVQFGQPLSKFQALQHKMADMIVEVQASRSAIYASLAALNDEYSRSKVISLAKLTVINAMQLVGRESIQLHGGIGMTEEYPVGHYFRYFAMLSKQYGDRTYQLARVTESYKQSEVSKAC